MQSRELKSERFDKPPPELPSSLTLKSIDLEREHKWKAIYEDRRNHILFVSLETGGVRQAPWISLRTDMGGIYYANLFTSETRWFPPHLWMEAWVSRPIACHPTSCRERSSIHCGNRFWPDSPLIRNLQLNPESGARLRIEGGAPSHLHERGRPQYPPDKHDTSDTYPELETIRKQLHTRA